MLARILSAATAALTLTAVAAHAQSTSYPGPANAVVRWNSVALDAFAPTEGTNSLVQSRTLAIFHAAIHDAVNAIDRRYESYTPGLPASSSASLDAVVASAAREVLVTLLPDQAALVDREYTRALTAVPDGAPKTAGIATGLASARATITRRQSDGADQATEPVYVPRPVPGDYQFTPPFNFAGVPGWGRVKPFVVNPTEYAVEGPQKLSSVQYARDLEYVKAFGHVASQTRTREQSEIARFWYEDSPLGWNRIASNAIQRRGLDSWTAARVFALVNFAMADGFIVGFEAKYRFRFWRPETAIRAAATDGNPRTEADTAWQPFLITPPVPDYPSTHTVLGWAAAEVLSELLGDRVRFDTTSLTLPNVTRSFRGFSEAAEENGQSRIYAGIHFRHAVRDGRRQGRSVGRDVAEALPPVFRTQ